MWNYPSNINSAKIYYNVQHKLILKYVSKLLTHISFKFMKNSDYVPILIYVLVICSDNSEDVNEELT